jgi:hypothetical protein
VVGYYSAPLPVPSRLMFIVAGLLLLLPSDAFRGAVLADIVGLALAAALLVRQMRMKRA